jgi:hypothetical protein
LNHGKGLATFWAKAKYGKVPVTFRSHFAAIRHD